MNQEKNARLSAVVICRNEEQNIVRCIQSLQLVTDDIVVVDSGSDDNTVLFAKVLGARVFERTWTGYSDQKNFGNNQALHPYIISIDADECISPELADSINEEMLAPSGSVYEFDFITSWEGKFVYHGSWYPDRHCRLFDKRKIIWDTQSVHEQLSMEGFTPHRLKGNIYHHTARDKDYYREKMTRYAKMFANSRRQEYRYSPIWKKYLSSSCRFMRDYIIRKGFLEGKAGLQIAVEETRYTFLKYKWSERRSRA